MNKRPWTIGVDIGGSKIEIAHVDQLGAIQLKKAWPVAKHGDPYPIIETLVENIEKSLIGKSESPLGVGIGIAGQVDTNTGIVHFAPNLAWKSFPLGEELKKALNMPVVITNDVRAATWGEWQFGSAVDCNDFVCLFIGTGIGGGVVSGGRLLLGSNNGAGELGHLIVAKDGPICSCGNKGCVEAFAGGWALAAHAKKALAQNAEARVLWEALGPLSAKTVIQQFKHGDPIAKKIIEEAREALIAAAITIVHAFNPQRFILGGGLFHGLPEIKDWMHFGIKKNALPALAEKVEVLSSRLGLEAGVIGAATFAMKVLKKG